MPVDLIGWGCVIRVAQMFFYKVLIETYYRQIDKNPEACLYLLKHFLDQPDRIFSIHNFCKHRQNLISGAVDVGEFWRSTYAIYTFKYIWEKLDTLLFK